MMGSPPRGGGEREMKRKRDVDIYWKLLGVEEGGGG